MNEPNLLKPNYFHPIIHSASQRGSPAEHYAQRNPQAHRAGLKHITHKSVSAVQACGRRITSLKVQHFFPKETLDFKWEKGITQSTVFPSLKVSFHAEILQLQGAEQ